MTALYEQFRPKTWDDVVGQPVAVKSCKALASRGIGGRCIALVGPSGTGKTSLARILAETLADPMNVVECDAQWLTPSRIADIEDGLSMYGLGAKSGRVVIVNEYHALDKQSLQQLLTTLERIPSHCAWLLTTTTDGEESLHERFDDAGPFGSRALTVKLSPRGFAEPMARRIMECLGSMNMDGRGLDFYVRIMKDARNNGRLGWQRAEAVALAGD